MPIASPERIIHKPDQVVTRDHNIAPEQVVATDTKYEPKQALLAHVSGSRWVVTYYRQLLDRDNAPEAFNIDRPAPYQQYIKINQFELRVTSPLQHSPDNATSSSQVSGTAIMHPSIVPNVGDLFIADIGDGRAAYFNIREVTQKSYLRDSVYEIEYDLTNYVTTEVLNVLTRHVVQETVYERRYADYGANPVLQIDEYRLYEKLQEWQRKIANHYFQRFFNAEHGTFLVPVEGDTLYDPFIIQAIMRLWNQEIVPEMRHLRVYNYDTSHNIIVKTIWDTLLRLDKYSLMSVKRNFYIIPRRLFNASSAILGSVAYTRIDSIYHPADMKDGRNLTLILPNMGPLQVSDIYSSYSTLRTLKLDMVKLPGLGFVHPSLKADLPIPDAKKFGTYDTYVLSPAFYDQDRANMSKVERFVMDALEDKPVSAKELMPILDDCINWGDLEQFYYIPVLTILARIALGDLSQ